MPRSTGSTIENNFSKGLLTEFTALNFPENACTDTDNCVFSHIGNVTRRLGIDYEVNRTITNIDRTGLAISYYKWNNAGGDGNTKVFVEQVGGTIYFYSISAATTADPLSDQKLASTVTLSSFVASGGSVNTALECQYSDGNGYLFITHPSCDPIYCVYAAGVITGAKIQIKTRDLTGIPELGIADDFRPSALTAEHNYNIQNQGWTNAPAWTATSTTSNTTAVGVHTWTVQTGLTISAAQVVSITATGHGGIGTSLALSGTVSSYNSGTGALVIDVTTSPGTGTFTDWTFTSVVTSFITTWHTNVGNYPSNADQWWSFKNSSNAFDTATLATVTQSNTPAPKGHFILDAFSQQRTAVSTITGLTAIATTVRPRTTSWYAGRVWYAGVDAAQAATGDAPNYTWTESLYFSQIIEKEDQFARCYQLNDPTSETSFDLLPSDGGVVRIQGCGSVFKLVPIQNGLLVFAANGIWFITGSQGIGFTANDYVVVKVSSIQSISGTSFIDVQGSIMWWNEEGIYTIQNGNDGLKVEPLTFATIDSFYSNIPLTCKKLARGDYDPLNYKIQWAYRSDEPSDVTGKYEFDRILNLSTATKAFYPWSISKTTHMPKIHGIAYIQGPGGSTVPDPMFKYLVSELFVQPNAFVYGFSFANELDTDYVDWAIYAAAPEHAVSPIDYTSYFVTGYKLHGNAQRKFQANYIYVFSNNETDTSYKIQGIWDFANSGNSGRYSQTQLISNDRDYFQNIYRRHKIRGQGLSLQIKVTSVAGEPFNIHGWSTFETANQGV